MPINGTDTLSVRTLLRLGDKNYRQENYLEALDFYEQAFDRERYNHKIASRLTDCLREIKRKISRYHREAATCYFNRNLEAAIPAYRKLAAFDTTHFQAHYRLGRAYAYRFQYDSAAWYYHKALQLDPQADSVRLELAVVQRITGNYAEAEDLLREVLKGKQSADSLLTDRAETQLAGCIRYRQDIRRTDDEAGFEVRNMPWNSEFSEYHLAPVSPSFFSDSSYTQELEESQQSGYLLTSHRPGRFNQEDIYPFSGEPFSDLYWIPPPELDPSGTIRHGGKVLNTESNDGAAFFDEDHHLLYTSICNGGDQDWIWGCSIYTAQFDTSKKQWRTPRILNQVNGTVKQIINSRGKARRVSAYDTQPFLVDSGRTMYFVSDREGGYGGTDIWFSQMKDGKWTAPQNVGPSINTARNEIYPMVSQSGMLYFASDGHVGLGGFDLYRSRGDSNQWSAPEHLSFPINTTYHEYNLLWEIEDSVGYVSSNRPYTLGLAGKESAVGRDDIWSVRKRSPKPAPQPEPEDTLVAEKPEPEHTRSRDELKVFGLIRDNETQQGIPHATVELFQYLPEDSIVKLKSLITPADGRYVFELDSSITYYIMAGAKGYVPNDLLVDGSELKINKDREVVLDLYLPRAVIGTPYSLDNIYYDYDKAYLRNKSIIDLHKVLLLLKTNPTYRIEIGSHTDSNGPDWYNQKLSERRAQSVVDFLRDMEVDPEKIVARGYGESQLIIFPELSDADRQLNRRSEFRILSEE